MSRLQLASGDRIGVRRAGEVVELEVRGTTVAMTLIEAVVLSELLGEAGSRR